jgi:hypothetical protein
MTLGTAGMHNQVRQWAAEGFLTSLLDLLLDHGYTVFLTTDHGNIECVGRGRPAEGAVADLRGERVRGSIPIKPLGLKCKRVSLTHWPGLLLASLKITSLY